MTESWRAILRQDVLPELPDPALYHLRDGLGADTALIQQGLTVFPYLSHNADRPPLCACPLAYALWAGLGLATVADVQEAFSALLARADPRGVGAVAPVLNWIDMTPRAEMRAALLAEVELALASRKAVADAAA